MEKLLSKDLPPTIYPIKSMIFCILYQLLEEKINPIPFPLTRENIFKIYNYLENNNKSDYCQYDLKILKICHYFESNLKYLDKYHCWQKDIIDFGKNVQCRTVKANINKFYVDYQDYDDNVILRNNTKCYTNKEMRLYENVSCYNVDIEHLHIFKLSNSGYLMIINVEDIEVFNILNHDINKMIETIITKNTLTSVDLIIPNLEYNYRQSFPNIYCFTEYGDIENSIKIYPTLNSGTNDDKKTLIPQFCYL